MPMKKMGSKEACISYNYKHMIAAGHPKKQAQAGSLNYCGKQWGGIPKKKKSKHEMLKYELIFELEDLKMMEKELIKEKERIQKLIKKQVIKYGTNKRI